MSSGGGIRSDKETTYIDFLTEEEANKLRAEENLILGMDETYRDRMISNTTVDTFREMKEEYFLFQKELELEFSRKLGDR